MTECENCKKEVKGKEAQPIFFDDDSKIVVCSECLERLDDCGLWERQ